MIRSFFSFAMGALIIGLLSFDTVTYSVKNSTADVNSYKGVLVFADSKPVREYTYLGSVKTKGGASVTLGMKTPTYPLLRDQVVDAARSDYPSLDAVVLSWDGTKMTADAIKFK